jgi:hypothetical protein
VRALLLALMSADDGGGGGRGGGHNALDGKLAASLALVAEVRSVRKIGDRYFIIWTSGVGGQCR